jgi:hypothetical protein
MRLDLIPLVVIQKAPSTLLCVVIIYFVVTALYSIPSLTDSENWRYSLVLGLLAVSLETDPLS